MSLVDTEKANIQLEKFNENLQRIIGKTKVIVLEIMKTDQKVAYSYKDVPRTLDLAASIVTGEFPLPNFDPIYGTICGFLNKGIDIFDMIHMKDDRILTEHISIIFPKNDYIEKIQFIYGANDQQKNYVSNEDITVMWKLIIANMHRAIKWVIFSGDERFINRLPVDVVNRYKINLST